MEEEINRQIGRPRDRKTEIQKSQRQGRDRD